MTYIPYAHRVTFALDSDRGRYAVEICDPDRTRPGFTRVPREVVVEDRRFNDDIQANLILRGTQTEKKTGGRSVKFFTGLQTTAQEGVYLGNVLTFGRKGERVRNGVVVRFSTDAARLTLLYFPACYPYPDAKAAFIAAILDRGLL